MYKPGENYVICDRCGFKRYASDCRKTWDNWLVCKDTCWEEKHPALTPIKLQPDKTRAREVRTEPAFTFIEPEE